MEPLPLRLVRLLLHPNPLLKTFHVTHTLALIDLVNVVTLSDIKNESKLRPIRQAIFDIAESQIDMYHRLENGEDEWESDDENSIDEDDEDGHQVTYSGDEDITGPSTPKRSTGTERISLSTRRIQLTFREIDRSG